MKNTLLPVSFFFGANNKYGYCSLYKDLYSPYIDGNHLILKGGPGTGKSTLMKKVAENKYLCVFEEAVRAATPGQALVLYDGEYVAGGGTIL